MELVSLMLALCRVALGGEAPTIPQPDAETLGALYALSKHHDMAHLVSYALWRMGWLDTASEAGAKFQKAQMVSVFRYEHQRTELERIACALEAAGIDFIPLKGSELRARYPEPWMRTSADIDVLVPQPRLADAERVLQSLDYHRDHDGAHDVSYSAPSGVHVELHFELTEKDSVLGEAAKTLLGEVWSHATPTQGHVHRHTMSDAMFYFYHVAHMAKHFYGGGCGVRSFVDLWLLSCEGEETKKTRAALISQGKLTAFEEVAVKLARAWFSTGEMLEGTARDMASFVIRGGTFGVAENRTAVQQGKGIGRVRYALQSVFMPYEKLCTYYASLKGRKYLTFFYQIRRILRLLREGKLRGGVREIRAAGRTGEDKIESTRDLLDRLGL
jgi:hypothetical protein